MGIGGKGRLGICVLVRAPDVPVFKDLSGTGEWPLRSPVYEETLVCSGVSSETERDLWISEERAGRMSVQKKGLLLLLLKKGGRRRRIKRPRETVIHCWILWW